MKSIKRSPIITAAMPTTASRRKNSPIMAEITDKRCHPSNTVSFFSTLSLECHRRDWRGDNSVSRDAVRGRYRQDGPKKIVKAANPISVQLIALWAARFAVWLFFGQTDIARVGTLRMARLGSVLGDLTSNVAGKPSGTAARHVIKKQGTNPTTEESS